MKEISLDEMKKIQLDILVDIANFCDNNGINYYLAGGTLLGAIRHKGFIPWDDDIDIMMPRNDYKKFVHNYVNKKYKVDYIEIDKKCSNRYARVNNIDTVLVGSWKEEKEEHVFVDIFPIDGMPDNKFMQKFIFFRQSILINIHLATMLRYTVSNRYNDRNAGFLSWKKYIRTLIKFAMVFTIGRTNSRFWAKLIDNNAQRYKFENSNYVACLVSGSNGSKELMSKRIFQKKIKIVFENKKFWAPIGYNKYLSNLYGDYMKIPPKEKQVSHHDFIAYWKGDENKKCNNKLLL